jgi:hypothetical protein
MFNLAAVDARVAHGAECDQVLTRIITGLAAKLFVVNFKIGHCPARLAFPAVTAENFVTNLVVGPCVQAQAWLFGSKLVHEAFSVACSRNEFFSSSERNLNSRRTE